MNLLIIDNIAAGPREGMAYDFARVFLADGDAVTIRTTAGATRIETLLDDATAFDGVVAAGGDGTLAAVCSALAGSGIPILPLPAGTANLTCINLSYPHEIHALVQMVREGRTLNFDLGEVETAQSRTSFVMIAGAGLDGLIMKTAAPLKQTLGLMAYFHAALTTVGAPRMHFDVDIDGEAFGFDGLGILGINFSQLPAGVSVTHENRPRDGLLDVALLKGNTALDLLPAVGAAILDLDGKYPERSEAVQFLRGREVRVHCEPVAEMQYDGDPLGNFADFTMRALPGATTFFVSEETFAQFTLSQCPG